ncbi:MAG: IMS domain-containing protein, partial [Anaerolineae bacterium]
TPAPLPVAAERTAVVSSTPAPTDEAATSPEGGPAPEVPTVEPTIVPPVEPTPTPEPPALADTPTPEPTPTRPPDQPTVDWRIEANRAVRDVVTRYGEVKVEALTYLIPDRLPELLTGVLLERQRRGVCGLKNAGQYMTYSNRSFEVLEVVFEDSAHARVLAYIEEDRVLYNSDGSVRKNYGHEFYRTIYLLEQKSDGRWYINCFEALPDDPLPSIWEIACQVELPSENPCNQ